LAPSLESRSQVEEDGRYLCVPLCPLCLLFHSPQLQARPLMTNLASNEFSWKPAATSLLQSLITVISLIAMASITIRKLPEGTKRRLRIRAARKGHSMEQEARELLQSALAQAEAQPENLGKAIRKIFAPLGGVDLKIPPRGPIRDPGIR